MTAVGIALLCVGIVLIAAGASRAQGPYRRAMALRDHERNLARYDSWRGGRYASADDGTSSVGLMERELLGRAGRWGAVAVGGFVLVFLGFFLR